MSSEPSNTLETSSHFQDLLEDLNSGMKAGRKRKIIGPIGPYLQAARWFPLAIDPFVVLEKVLYDGMEAEFAELQGNSAPGQCENVNSHQKSCEQYNALVKLVPTFSDVISGFEKVPSAMDNFIHALSSAANDARSDDTGSLMREGLVYMLKNPGSDQFNPPLVKQQGKMARGWNHPQTARLLCPMRMLDMFDQDPQSFMVRVREGQIKITAAKLPAFLYDQSVFDSARKSRGCLQGYYLKRVFRHIFTGPSSALSPNARRGTKTPKGRIHGMSSPLPRAIAYAAVQAYFQLSSATVWCQEIEDLSLVDLYDKVAEMFEGNSNKEWVEETLRLWKLETPGLQQHGRSRARRDVQPGTFDDSEDDMDGFFDSDEHPPDVGNGGNHRSTEDNVRTETSNRMDGTNVPDNSESAHQVTPTQAQPTRALQKRTGRH